ncbi:MAG: histidine ammonia-lyase [Euryarchaeota archaeon]|nr:histidine ammonia-lyase [Euryarchaeota archaeon]|tara:strand:- start:485 stop:2002 length:1518 start_codon:yes stop_codon:yes gene_type:complete
MREIILDGKSMTLEDIMSIGSMPTKILISKSARKLMADSREYVESILESDESVYGINTGFGSLSNVKIEPSQLQQLQRNLILSHACGIGPNMNPVTSLRMLAIRANSLAVGVSGIRPEVVDTMLDLVNSGYAPTIPSVGSLGASGDLAPLAHMAMALIGEGQFMCKRGNKWEEIASKTVFENIGKEPVTLSAKEGLSLINGTSQMAAYLAEASEYSDRLCVAADAACAMSIEAIAGSHKPFDPRIHNVRSQPGQRVSASRILSHLHDSEINKSHEECQRVQDAYSFRCAPQVHGAAIDVVKSSAKIAISDVNSATDNPLILSDDVGGYDVISGGNFHGEPLALAADNLAAAIHEICSISERRTNQMLMPSWSGLPAYLAKNSGLESGLMIMQYVSAAAIARIRLLASPASLTNIPVSGGKEDHVSMGSTACQRLDEICSLAASVIGNEMLVASAALDLRKHKPGKGVQKYHEMVRSLSDPIEGDRSMSGDTNRIAGMILGEAGRS